MYACGPESMTPSEETPPPLSSVAFLRVTDLASASHEVFCISTWHIMVLLAQVQNRSPYPKVQLLSPAPSSSPRFPLPSWDSLLARFSLLQKKPQKRTLGKTQLPTGVFIFIKIYLAHRTLLFESPTGKQKW